MKFEISPGWEIPAGDLSIVAVHSSGPGGQNVNKVSTKVQLRFSALHGSVLSAGQKDRLLETFRSYLNQAGELLISCDETRSLSTNKERALLRLRSMLLSIARPPKHRHKTQPTRGSRERRLTGKKRRSELKQQRRSPPT
ncbi:MAG TPA: alternative ribosome rescue aminoacyl-tRNA hydrolase ArfB [Polyangiaceae bacterium]|nr:alternative ribosome rescue aminoacyl-tRNA hydrolase ArfB [Polyangiaceae bacterium]